MSTRTFLAHKFRIILFKNSCDKCFLKTAPKMNNLYLTIVPVNVELIYSIPL